MKSLETIAKHAKIVIAAALLTASGCFGNYNPINEAALPYSQKYEIESKNIIPKHENTPDYRTLVSVYPIPEENKKIEDLTWNISLNFLF
jgi:hypothetical protein